MSDRPLVQPVTAEQAEREEQFRQRVGAAQGETVRSMAVVGASLSEMAESASWFAEELTRKHRHPDSPPVACKAGCSWCCYQAVAVTAAEAARIARFLEGDEPGKRDAIDRLKGLDAKTRGLTPLQRAALRAPCAFLQRGQCGIYAVRPLACAEFTSYDVERCKQGQGTGYAEGGVIHEKARMLAYNAVYSGLSAGLASAFPKADTVPLELTAAVLAFLEEPALESQWASGARDLSACHLNTPVRPGP